GDRISEFHLANNKRWTTDHELLTRRRIALLAAVPKTFSLFSTFSDLSLFDLPYRFCQPYGDVHRIDHWAIGNRTPSRIPDRTIHSRRRAEGAPEKSRDADDGRSPDCDFDYCADAAVGGSGEPLRVDGGAFDCDFCG